MKNSKGVLEVESNKNQFIVHQYVDGQEISTASRIVVGNRNGQTYSVGIDYDLDEILKKILGYQIDQYELIFRLYFELYHESNIEIIDVIQNKVIGEIGNDVSLIAMNITDILKTNVINTGREILLNLRAKESLFTRDEYIEFREEDIHFDFNYYLGEEEKVKKEYAFGETSTIEVGIKSKIMRYRSEGVQIKDISIYPVFNYFDGASSRNIGMGEGWKTNIHQTLKKAKTYYAPLEIEGGLVYEDGEGIKHEIKEEYYYFEGKEKQYVRKQEVYIGYDQKLKCKDRLGEEREVTYKAVTEEGYEYISGKSLNNYQKAYRTKYTFAVIYADKEEENSVTIREDGEVEYPIYVEEVNDGEVSISPIEIEIGKNISIRGNEIRKVGSVKRVISYDETHDVFKATHAGEKGEKIETLFRIKTENIYDNLVNVENGIYVNEKIEQNIEQIESLKERIEEHQKTIKRISKNITLYGWENSELNSTKWEEIDNLYQEIGAQKNRLNEYQKRCKGVVDAILEYERKGQKKGDIFRADTTIDTSLIKDIDEETYATYYQAYNAVLAKINLDILSNTIEKEEVYEKLLTEKNNLGESINKYNVENQVEILGMEMKNAFDEYGKLEQALKNLQQYETSLIEEQKEEINDYLLTPTGEEFGFDGYGRLKTIQRNDEEYTIEYHSKIKERIESIVAKEEKVTFTYDEASDLLKSIIDSKGRRIQFTYDEEGRVKEVIRGKEKIGFERSENDLRVKDYNKEQEIHFHFNQEGIQEIKQTSYASRIDEKGVQTQANEIILEDETITYGVDSITLKALHGRQEVLQFDHMNRLIHQENELGEIYLCDYEDKEIEFEGEYNKNIDILCEDVDERTTINIGEQITRESLRMKGLLAFVGKFGLALSSAPIELKIKVTNEDGEEYTYPYKKVFIEGKEYCLPFYIEPQKVESITIEFLGENKYYFNGKLILFEGERKEKDKEKNVIKEYNSSGISEYSDFENKNAHQVKERNIFQEETKYQLDYDNENKLHYVEDDKGNVQEYEYDEKQYLKETLIYNKKDASLKKIEKEEENYNKNSITFDHYTGEILSITKNIFGVNNSILFQYTHGYLTTLKNKGMKVNYAYDAQGRITEIKINDEVYVKSEYQEDIQIKEPGFISNHARSEFDRYFNGYEEERIYDEKGLLKKERMDDVTAFYQYDRYQNLIKVTYSDSTPTEIKDYDSIFTNSVKRYDHFHYYTDYVYDEKGRLAKLSYSKNLGSETYQYDETNSWMNKITWDNQNEANLQYDVFGRVIHQEIVTPQVMLCHEYSYLQDGERTKDAICADETKIQIQNGETTQYISDRAYYKYDEKGNIIEIDEDDTKTRYIYDEESRLIREDNELLDKTYVYKYDASGNILIKKEYPYSIQEDLRNPIVNEYVYQCKKEQDRLVAFNGEIIQYNDMGQMTSYQGKNYSWNKKGLLTNIDNTIEYFYHPKGMRTKKIVDGIETNYLYDGTKLLRMTTSNYEITFRYLANAFIGFQYTKDEVSKEYYYRRNIHGDVIEIYDEEGLLVGKYSYDAYGNCTIVKNIDDIAFINPFRYRGYYFDNETGFYYLQARYYNPLWGRFISIDHVSYLNPQSVNGLNLYCYCNNNPVMYADPSGHFWDTVFDILFIGWDIYNLCRNEGYKDWKNWVSLGVDILFAAIPFVVGGGGQIVKLANVADDISDFSKVTVVGESMTRVKTVSQFLNATDNLYDGFKIYNKLSDLGIGGKILAEIGGKVDNVAWLYGKLRSGYRVVDIGIDSTRIIRSSSYIVERVTMCLWKNRNLWKWLYHLDF